MPSGADAPRLWDFAVRVYGRDGVAQACMSLQDAFDIDVPLLLFAAWLGDRRPLDAQRAKAACDSVATWQSDIVASLRVVRQRLKSNHVLATSPATEALRQAVKACELEAERIELGFLQTSVDDMPTTQGYPGTLDNLHHMFTAQTGRAPNQHASALLTVIAAAARLETEGTT